MSAAQARIAILSPTNVDFLKTELVRRSGDSGLEVYVPPYGQVVQSTHDPSSALYSFEPDVVFLFWDTDDVLGEAILRPFAESSTGPADALRVLESTASQLQSTLPGARLILNTIPAPTRNGLIRLERQVDVSLVEQVDAYNADITRIVGEIPGAVVFDYQMLASSSGLNDWYDSRMWYLARSRLGAEALKTVADGLMSLLDVIDRPRTKCIVVDLDNTCWGGIAGEDGPANVQIGSEGLGLAFADFQRALLNFRDQGVLLAVASKNDPATVEEVFSSHPGMVLAADDISCWRVGWGDKATSLEEIAEDLNIGLDALLFIDDTPVERDLVRSLLPEVKVMDLPSDPAHYVDALFGETALHAVSLTDADRTRPGQYQQRKARTDHEGSFRDIGEYLSSLEMKATIGELTEATADRIVQLIQKTNQFNLTTKRWSLPELTAAIEAGSHRAYWLRLTDKFGDEGLICVAVVKTGEPWSLDTFIMSCRVIGRGVENSMMRHIAAEAAIAGASELIATYIPTARNGLVSDLLPRLGMTAVPGMENTWTAEVSSGIFGESAHLEISVEKQPG